MKADICINGTVQSLELEGYESLLFVLREQLGIRSVKGACEEGECGSCSVFVDDALVCSCLVHAADAHGSRVVTMEGLSDADRVCEVQDALLQESGVQCGFCTPGFVMGLTALLRHDPCPKDADIREALAGNLCRCTGYQQILQAARSLRQGAADDI